MENLNDNNFDKNTLVVDYLTLRKAVGILGVALPVVLLVGSFVFGECNRVEKSISDYYYTVMGHYLVGTLCAVSLFLFSYKGYDKTDNRASNLAALFAVGVAFFPTACADHNPYCNVLTTNSSDFVNTMHNLIAALFFLTLAFYSYFLFTKSTVAPSARKEQRNNIYKICAVVMLAAVVLIALILNIPFLEKILSPYKPVFILETTALWAFGVSWLVKGQFILKDK
jgi:hypothetical protein